MTRPKSDDGENTASDLAARAAWMSFVGGLTQDQIAANLGISRQRVQRLVARASADGLIRVRIDHPVSACLDLEQRLKEKFGLAEAWVAPSAGNDTNDLSALSAFGAPIFESIFARETPLVVGVGTGRTLSGVVEQMRTMDAHHHKLVSLIGNVAPDGSASLYEVIMRLAGKLSAPHFLMSAPVQARTLEELEQYRALPHIRATRALAETADLALVGIGQMDKTAPLYMDGFISAEELADLQRAGARGEMCGHIFDENGAYLAHPVNDRMVGVRLPIKSMKVYCIAGGYSKRTALRAALKGNLIYALITDEHTARHLIEAD